MKNRVLFLLLSFALFSCNKADDLLVSPDVYTPPVEKIKGSITGQVISESGRGIENVIVQVGNHLQKTGPGGYFRLRNIPLDANGTFIQAHQTGYFQASRRFFPKPGATNYTTLTLMRKRVDGEINAASGGKINAGWDAEITLPANGIVTASGAPYTGTVKVAARYLPSTSEETPKLAPGNHQGITANNEVVAFVNFGVMAVELTGSNGTLLNLAPGSKAELRIPIFSTSPVNDAPAEIPLWYFDEATGHWREEGKAVKQGDEYVGEVSHFSFWSWNIPLPFVNIEGRLVDPDGNPLKHTQIHLRVDLSGIPLMISGYGATDDNGEFAGQVPANMAIELTSAGFCGHQLSSHNIGPFTTDTNLGDLDADAGTNGFTKITGTLVNCDNTPVVSGVVELLSGHHYTFVNTNSDGSFELAFAQCESVGIDEVVIVGFDLDAETQGTQQQLTVSPEINLGEFSVCASEIQEYIYIDVNGQDRLYLNTYYFGGQPGAILTMGGFAPDSSYALRFTFPASGPGSYTGAGVKYWSHDFFPAFMVAACEAPCNNLTVNVTEYGNAQGEYLRGTFNGTIDYYDAAQQLVGGMPVTGDFSIRR